MVLCQRKRRGEGNVGRDRERVGSECAGVMPCEGVWLLLLLIND